MYQGNYTPEKDGHFDMKITLTDDSGNSQTQVLSNAFSVASLGITETATISGNVDVYDMTGCIVIENQEWKSLRLPEGIYLIRDKVSGKTIKHIIR